MNPFTAVEAKHRASYAMSSMAKAQSASRIMLTAWVEATAALDAGGRGTVADLAALRRLHEAEKVADVVADGVFDAPGARLVARRGQVAGRRRPFSIR